MHVKYQTTFNIFYQNVKHEGVTEVLSLMTVATEPQLCICQNPKKYTI